MKNLCLLILIAFIFGDTYLPKYGSIQMDTESGVFYFNTSDFGADSYLYFQTNVENGNVDKYLLYEFSSTEPSDSHSFIIYHSLENYATGESSNTVKGKTTYSYEYYYELKNDNTQKYLYVKYNSFNGTSLEIESTRLSIGTFIFLIFVIVVILFFIVLTIVKKIIRSKKNNAYNNVPQNQYHNMNNNPQQEPQQEHQQEQQEQQEIQDDQSQHIVINS